MEKEKTKTRSRITKADRLRAIKENGKVKLDEDRIIKDIEENALYINKTQLNEKIINDFYKFYKRKIKRADFYSLIFCGIILVIIGINFLLQGEDYFFGIICNIIINACIIGLGIYLCVYSLKYQKFDKKESKKIYNDDISTYINQYYFSNENVVIINKEGKTEKKYNGLDSIYEAKNFYYILLTKNSGFAMSKDSFVKGTESDFHNFIKEKMGKNYKKRCHKKNK